MKKSIKEIKNETSLLLKIQLKNYLGVSLVALIVFQGLIFLGFHFLKMPGIILSCIEVYAFVHINLLVLDGKNVSLSDLLAAKINFWNMISTYILTVFIGYLIVIPFLMFILSANMSPVSILIIILLFIVEIYYMIRISFVLYLIRDFNVRPLEAVAESFNLTSGNVKRIIFFHFSFLGWILLIPFTLGLAALWVLPYIQVSFANLYRTIYIEKRNTLVIKH
jgi:Protein of unknown function (DUF975)